MKQVAHYTLLEHVGSGGMGEVYRARDTKLGRTVAIKMLPEALAADPVRRERFMEEARATAALSHPSIATLFEVGEVDGRMFLAFEYVPGETLRRAVAGGAMPPRRAVPLAIQMADALAEAHATGIIHRDIKPDNVILTPRGSAKVLDFGLASFTEGGVARETAPTRLESDPALVVGTLAYMSPEQARGQALDPRTDIFSLGVVLYEMLTGQNPFTAPTAAATLLNVVQRQPQGPATIQPHVGAALDAIVMRALDKDPAARYASAAELAADLRHVFGERTEHGFQPAPPIPSGGTRAPRRLWPVALLVAVVTLAGIAYPYRADIWRWWKRTMGSPPAPLVAVIPLEEIGEEEQWFADGLTEDMIMRLGQTPGLRVLGRSSTRSYRGRSPSDVARELGAAVVLTGSVRREQGDLKVSLELIDPSDGVQIWRRQFVRTASSVLALQSEIADSVASALEVELVGLPARTRTTARTVYPEAYETYTRARAAAAARQSDRAIELYEQAIRLDEGLAEAYAGLASTLFHRGTFMSDGLSAHDEARIRDAAMRAALIEPDLPEVEIAAGLTAPSLHAALEHMVRALKLDPSHADAYHEFGDQISGFQPERALRVFSRSRALDPLLFANYPDGVVLNVMLGRVEEAKAVLGEARRIFPQNPFLPSMESVIAEKSGEVARAVALFEKTIEWSDTPPAAWLALARLYYRAGRLADAERALRTGLAKSPDYCEGRAALAGLLADGGRLREARRIAPARGAASSLRCEATAAAALGDSAGVAAVFRRIATDEKRLRNWFLLQFGLNGEFAWSQRLYPWNKVAEAPEVVSAYEQVRAAADRLAPVIQNALASLPPESR
jgi:TolB-like protein/Tfp pilus assembly protein PilF